MGPIMAPTGPDVSCISNLGQFGGNLASWRIFALNILLYSQNRARKVFAWIRALSESRLSWQL